MEKNKVKVSLDYEVIRKPMYNSYLGTIQNAIVKRMFKMRVNNPTSEVSKAVAHSFFAYMQKNEVEARIEKNTVIVTILFAKEKQKIKDLYQAWRHYDLFLVLEQVR